MRSMKASFSFASAYAMGARVCQLMAFVKQGAHSIVERRLSIVGCLGGIAPMRVRGIASRDVHWELCGYGSADPGDVGFGSSAGIKDQIHLGPPFRQQHTVIGIGGPVMTSSGNS